MEPLRLDSQDALRPAWAGVGEEGHLPVRAERNDGSRDREADASGAIAEGADASARAKDRTGRPWWRTALRLARDAAIGLALITAVPVAVVAVRGVPLPPSGQELQARMDAVEPLRAHTLPVNANISPGEAGAAMHRLHTQLRAATGPFFPGLGEPVPRGQASAGQPLSLEQLRAVAEHPIWREVDRIASAADVDVLGGAYPLGIPAETSAWDMAIPPMARLKELTNASTMRSEYYRMIGEPEQAIAAAQATIGLGFAYIDDGRSTISALVGRVVMAPASDDLQLQYQMLGDQREFEIPAVKTSRNATPTPSPSLSPSAYSQRILEYAGDPALPRSVRWEQVQLQSLMSCNSTKAMLLPNSAALEAMYAKARQDLARFPSEHAYLALIERTSNSLPPGAPALTSLGDRLVMGAAAVAATVLQNPRVEACTRLAVELGQ